MRFKNYNVEAQCTPTRSALLTGRLPIRTGNCNVPLPGQGHYGLAPWEYTLGELFSRCRLCHRGLRQVARRRHRGETDPWYVPGRDPVAHMLEGRKGEKVREAARLTYDLKRNVDVEYQRRAFQFMEEHAGAAAIFSTAVW